MTPERVLAKNNQTGKYVLFMGSVMSDIVTEDNNLRYIALYQKYPGLDFDPSDVDMIEKALFLMRTIRNSTHIGTCFARLNDESNRYILMTANGQIIADDLRTLSVCLKVAVERFCGDFGYEIIQRF